MSKIKRALISVSNKEGIVDFAKGLKEFGVEIISTGGTGRMLKDNGIEVINISDWLRNLPEKVKIQNDKPEQQSKLLIDLTHKDKSLSAIFSEIIKYSAKSIVSSIILNRDPALKKWLLRHKHVIFNRFITFAYKI